MLKALFILTLFSFAFIQCEGNGKKATTKGSRYTRFAVLSLGGPKHTWDATTTQRWRDALESLQLQTGAKFNLKDSVFERGIDPKFKTAKLVKKYNKNALHFAQQGETEKSELCLKVVKALNHLFKYFDSQNTKANPSALYFVVPQISRFPLAKVPYGQEKSVTVEGPVGTVYDIYPFENLTSALEFGIAPEVFLKKHPKGARNFQIDLDSAKLEETKRFAKQQTLPLKDFARDDSRTPLLDPYRSASPSSSRSSSPQFPLSEVGSSSDSEGPASGSSSPRSYGSTISSTSSPASSPQSSPSFKGKEKASGYLPLARI